MFVEPKAMIHCSDCEFFHRDETGRITLTCDPFATIKEPACLLKWQFLKISQMVEAYQATLRYYQKLAPMQDKLFRAMERELEEMSEAERWKYEEDEDEDEDQQEDQTTEPW